MMLDLFVVFLCAGHFVVFVWVLLAFAISNSASSYCMADPLEASTGQYPTVVYFFFYLTLLNIFFFKQYLLHP